MLELFRPDVPMLVCMCVSHCVMAIMPSMEFGVAVYVT